MKHTTLAQQRRVEAHEAELTRIHGPVPINIFRQLRLSNDLSLQGLAIQTGLSKDALVRAEQGTYSNPLPTLTGFWVRRGVNELVITDGYELFQYKMRLRNFHYFGVNLDDLYDLTLPVHPFRQLRKNRDPFPVGLVALSQALCIPIDTLRYWEKKYRTQKTVPKQVVQVLSQIGYTQHEIQQFCRSYEVWRSDKAQLTLVGN